MPTTTATNTPPATATATTSAVPRVLAAAFVLSAVHTGYAAVAGIADPTFTVTTPAAWLFYAVGIGSVWLARRQERWAQIGVLAYLVVLLAISVFYYPTTFTVEKQTVFGWFENDVYVGLLMIATYLTVGRVRSSPSAR
ncbi:hypothetical protein [Rhodococcus maanshanensis]|uniref:Uncharacterized protein n=1 Tax=Rhodococcus maanshanensis TaxID=183556 RepID=A0A1H7V1V5_9NOCA|nr:hypothetical protein [Rhodococcus maanshanensis]SEM03019.1 hypothetical protein SAMN05444583_12042 [Rhodococcus maanshanensis]